VVSAQDEDLTFRSEANGAHEPVAIPTTDEIVGGIEDLRLAWDAAIHVRVARGVDRHIACTIREVATCPEGIHLAPLGVDIEAPPPVVVGHDNPSARIE